MPITGPPGYDPSKVGGGLDKSEEELIKDRPVPKADEMKSELLLLWKTLTKEGFPKPKPW
jgi:hypothetical protein